MEEMIPTETKRKREVQPRHICSGSDTVVQGCSAVLLRPGDLCLIPARRQTSVHSQFISDVIYTCCDPVPSPSLHQISDHYR